MGINGNLSVKDWFKRAVKRYYKSLRLAQNCFLSLREAVFHLSQITPNNIETSATRQGTKKLNYLVLTPVSGWFGLRADEGRAKLRKSAGRRKESMIRRFPNRTSRFL